MRSVIALGLFSLLTLTSAAQMPCGPCGSPCGPTTGPGVGAPPNLGAGRGETGDDVDLPGRKQELKDAQSAVDYILDKYKDDPYQAGKDPAVRELIQRLHREGNLQDRFVIEDLINQAHDHHPGDDTTTRLPDSATQDYVCHDHAWNRGNPPKDRGPQSVDPAKIVDNPEAYGFTRIYTGLDSLAQYRLQDGDVVLYRDGNGKITHSGLVTSVDAQGNVLMVSKDANNSLFRHTLLPTKSGETNYFLDAMTTNGGGVTFFRPGPNANPYQAVPSANAPANVGPAPAPPAAPAP